MAGKREVSIFRDLDIFGQWLSGGLVLYGISIPCIAALSLPHAEEYIVASSGLYWLAIQLSLSVAVIALTTGYFEHGDRRILVALISASALQAWALSEPSGCCSQWLRWLDGGIAEPTLADLFHYVFPLASNCLLIWAYCEDARHRLKMSHGFQRHVRNRA